MTFEHLYTFFAKFIPWFTMLFFEKIVYQICHIHLRFQVKEGLGKFCDSSRELLIPETLEVT